MLPIPPLGFGLPDFGKIIINAIESIIKTIAGALLNVVNAILYGLQNILVSAPYPKKASGAPAFFDPRNAANSSSSINLWHELLNNGTTYVDIVLPIALTIFVVAFAVGYFGKLFEEFPGMENFTPSITRIFFLFLLTITWLPVMTGVLAFSDGIAQLMIDLGSIGSAGNVSLGSGGGGVSDLAVALLQLLFAIIALVFSSLGVAFWGIRYALLYQLGLFMPVILAFKAFDEIQLPFVSTIGDTGWDLWFFAAFANIPSAIIFLFFGAVQQITGPLSGSGGLAINLFVATMQAVIPLLAIYAPMVFLFFGDEDGAVGRVGDTVTDTASTVGAAATGSVAAGVQTALDDEDDSSAVGSAGVELTNRLADSNNPFVSSAAKKGQRAAMGAQQASRAARGEELVDFNDENQSALAKSEGKDDAVLVDEDNGTGVLGAAAGSAARNANPTTRSEGRTPDLSGDGVLDRLSNAAGDVTTRGRRDRELAQQEADDEVVVAAYEAEEAAGGINSFVDNVGGREEALDAYRRGYDGEYEEQLQMLNMAANGNLRADKSDISTLERVLDGDLSAENLEDNITEIKDRDDIDMRDRQLDTLVEEMDNRSTLQDVRERANETGAENVDAETVTEITEKTSVDNADELASASVDDLTGQMAGLDEDEARAAINTARTTDIKDTIDIPEKQEEVLQDMVDEFDIENAAELYDVSNSMSNVDKDKFKETQREIVEDIEQETLESASGMGDAATTVANQQLQEIGDATIEDLKDYEATDQFLAAADEETIAAVEEVGDIDVENDFAPGVDMEGVVEQVQKNQREQLEESFDDVEEMSDAKVAETVVNELDQSTDDVVQVAEAAAKKRTLSEEGLAAEAGNATNSGSTTSGEDMSELLSGTDMTQGAATDVSSGDYTTPDEVRNFVDNNNIGTSEDALYDAIRSADNAQEFKKALEEKYGVNETDRRKAAAALYGDVETADDDDDTPDVEF